MKRLLIRPWYEPLNNNRLFNINEGERNHSLQPFARLRELCCEYGIEAATWDCFPLQTADVILFHDLPYHRKDVEKAKKAAPKAIFILMLFESYLGRSHWFLKENHDLFDAVLTYDPSLADEKRYFHYNLPTGIPEQLPSLPYSERRPLVMISSNRMACFAGLLGQRQPGWDGLPFFGPIFSGWKVPWSSLPFQLRGETYSHRSHIGRVADKKFPELLDIYGPGWRGEPISWIHKLIPHPPYRSARGLLPKRKIQILRRYRFSIEFENLRADMNYMCEKIFDCLYAGVVPVYLGNERVHEQVTPECFVDARKFRSDKDLLAYVQGCSEKEWQAMHVAGQQYIRSDQMRKFLPDSFAERVMEVILKVIRQ